jgi:hypothetical protein
VGKGGGGGGGVLKRQKGERVVATGLTFVAVPRKVTF